MNFSLFARGMHAISCLSIFLKFSSFNGGEVESAIPNILQDAHLPSRRPGDGNICTATLEQTEKWLFAAPGSTLPRKQGRGRPLGRILPLAPKRAGNISRHNWKGLVASTEFNPMRTLRPSSISLFWFESFCCAGCGFPPVILPIFCQLSSSPPFFSIRGGGC